MKQIITILILALFSCSKPLEPPKMEQKIRRLLLLPAYEHIYRDIIYFNEKKSFIIFKLYDKEILFSINIKVQAGVDLNRGFSLEKTGDKSIHVTLPRAEILLADADENSIEEMFITEFGKEIQRLDYYSEIEAQKDNIINDAIKRGILINAEENTDVMLTNLLKSAGYENVTIEFKDKSGEVIDEETITD